MGSWEEAYPEAGGPAAETAPSAAGWEDEYPEEASEQDLDLLAMSRPGYQVLGRAAIPQPLTESGIERAKRFEHLVRFTYQNDDPSELVQVARLKAATGLSEEILRGDLPRMQRFAELQGLDFHKYAQENSDLVDTVLAAPRYAALVFKDKELSELRKLALAAPLAEAFDEKRLRSAGFASQEEVAFFPPGVGGGLAIKRAGWLREQGALPEPPSKADEAKLEADIARVTAPIPNVPTMPSQAAGKGFFGATMAAGIEGGTSGMLQTGASKAGFSWLLAEVGGKDSTEAQKRHAELSARAGIAFDYPNAATRELAAVNELMLQQYEGMKGGGIGVGAAALISGAVSLWKPDLGKKLFFGSGKAPGLAQVLGGAGVWVSTFELEAGSAYPEYRKMRLDDGAQLKPEEAAGAAVAYGILSATTELAEMPLALGSFGAAGEAFRGKLGLGALKKLLKNPLDRKFLADLGKRYAKHVAGELAEEGVQTWQQDVVGWFQRSVQAGAPQKVDAPGTLADVGETLQQMAPAMVVAGGMGPAISVTTQVASRAWERDRAARAEPVVAKLADIAENSQTAEASPQVAADFAARVTVGTGEAVRSLFLDPEGVTRLYQSPAELEEGAKELLGEDGPRKLEQAIQTGQRIEVPVADFFARFKGVAREMVPYATTRPGYLTVAKKAELQKEIEAEAQAIVAAREKGEEAPALSEAERRAMDLARELAATRPFEGKIRPAEETVFLVRKAARTLAARAGVPAEEVFEHYVVRARMETEAEARARREAAPAVAGTAETSGTSETSRTSETSEAPVAAPTSFAADWERIHAEQRAAPRAEGDVKAGALAATEPTSKPDWLAPRDYFEGQEAWETLWSVFPPKETDAALQRALLGQPFEVLWAAKRALDAPGGNEFLQAMRKNLLDWAQRKATGDKAYDMPFSPRMTYFLTRGKEKLILRGKSDATVRVALERSRPRPDLTTLNAQGELVDESGKVLFQSEAPTEANAPHQPGSVTEAITKWDSLSDDERARLRWTDQATGLYEAEALNHLEPDPSLPKWALLEFEGAKDANDRHTHAAADAVVRAMALALPAGVKWAAKVANGIVVPVRDDAHAQEIATAVQSGLPAPKMGRAPQIVDVTFDPKGSDLRAKLAVGGDAMAQRKGALRGEVLREVDGKPTWVRDESLPKTFSAREERPLGFPSDKAFRKWLDTLPTEPMRIKTLATELLERYAGDPADTATRDAVLLADGLFSGKGRSLVASREYQVAVDWRGIGALDAGFGHDAADFIMSWAAQMVGRLGGWRFDYSRPHGKGDEQEAHAHKDELELLKELNRRVRRKAGKTAFIRYEEGGGGTLVAGLQYVWKYHTDARKADLALRSKKRRQHVSQIERFEADQEDAFRARRASLLARGFELIDVDDLGADQGRGPAVGSAPAPGGTGEDGGGHPRRAGEVGLVREDGRPRQEARGGEEGEAVAPSAARPHMELGAAPGPLSPLTDEERQGAPHMLFAGPPGDPRGYVQIEREGLKKLFTVVLTEKSDLSTFLHESGHIFLEFLGDLAARAEAPQSLKDDWARALKFLGAEDRAGLTTEHHEKWARAFEAYLMEGQAPSAELAKPFKRFAGWLKKIYRAIRALNVELDEEIRGVFDRLLATDEEIDAAKARAGLKPMWRSPAEAGMSPDEWQAYIEEQEAANEYARRAAELRELRRWLRTRKPAWLAEQKKALEDAGKEYDLLPATRARRALETGELVDDEGTLLVTLPKLPDAEEIATLFGYPNGQALAEAALANPERGPWSKERAAELMRERHPDEWADRARLKELTEEALHDKPTSRWLFREWAAIRSRLQQGPGGGTLEAIELAAERLAENMEVSEIAPGRALQAERLASERAFRHAAKKDYPKAFAAKQQQLLNHLLWRELKEAAKQRDQVLDFAKKAAKDEARAKVGLGGPLYRDFIDGVLEQLELTPIRQERDVALPSVAVILERMKADASAIDEDLMDRVEQALSRVDKASRLAPAPRGVSAFDRLTIAEMRDVKDALFTVRHTALGLSRITIADRQLAVEDALTEMEAAAAKALPEQPRGHRAKETEGALLRLRKWFQAKDSEFTEPALIFEMLGGEDRESPFHRFFIDGYLASRQKLNELSQRYLKRMEEAWEKLPKAMKESRFDAVDLSQSLPFPADVLERAHLTDSSVPRSYLWMLALNRGNLGNLQRLLDGYGWTVEQLDQALAEHLTGEELDWVQSVVDSLEELWPELAELHERETGLRPGKVKATPWALTLATGETVKMKGGYFPAKYDPRPGMSQRAYAATEKDIASILSPQTFYPATRQGHTKKRAERVVDLINLDWGVYPQHVAQVLHDLSFRSWVRQAARVVLNPRFEPMVLKHLGEAYLRQIKPWLQQVANAQADAVPAHLRGSGSILSWVRGRLALSSLGYNVGVMAADFANPVLAVASGGLGWRGTAYLPQATRALSPGLAKVRGLTSAQWWKFTEENSATLRHRRGRFLTHMKRHLAEMGEDAGKRSRLAPVHEMAFVGMETTDKLTSTQIWLAAYWGFRDEAIAQNELDPDSWAVRRADDLIERHFPAEAIAEKPAVLRDKRAWAQLLMFYGFVSKVYNLKRRALHGMWVTLVDSEASAGEKAFSVGKFAGKMLGISAALALGDLLSGRGPEDDEEWWQWWTRKLSSGLAVGIPGLDIAIDQTLGYAMLGERPKLSWRAPLPALLETLGASVYKAFAPGKEPAERAGAALRTGGLLYGLPNQVWKTGGYLYGLATGEAEPRGPGDVAGGLVWGERRNQPTNPATAIQDLVSGR